MDVDAIIADVWPALLQTGLFVPDFHPLSLPFKGEEVLPDGEMI
jgi:hypothetical protein